MKKIIIIIVIVAVIAAAYFIWKKRQDAKKQKDSDAETSDESDYPSVGLITDGTFVEGEKYNYEGKVFTVSNGKWQPA